MALGKCCFCIPLRAGCLIIGYLNLIGATILTLFTTYNLVKIVMYVLSNDHYGGPDPESMRMGAIVASVNVAVLIFYIHLLVFTIVLLVGLHQQKRGHVKAYLIYALIIVVLYIIYAALTNVLFGRFMGVHINAAQIAEHVIFILLSIFFLVVIRNYYLQMEEPAKKPTIYYNTAQVGPLV